MKSKLRLFTCYTIPVISFLGDKVLEHGERNLFALQGGPVRDRFITEVVADNSDILSWSDWSAARWLPTSTTTCLLTSENK